MLRLPLVLLALASAGAFAAVVQDPPGYRDTPKIPGSDWRVHDADRPPPRVIQPGDGTAPPSDAIVLFDGSSLDAWTGRNDEASWKLVDGAMEVNGTGDIRTREQFGDVQLHLEWRTPPEVTSSSQGRGNSGVFFCGRYEVQILDSYENRTYADGQAAALYGQRPPMVNASRGPGEWQTYDILFFAPRFDAEGELTQPARITVLHNGVAVHHAQPLLGDTLHRAAPRYQAHAEKGPIKLQDHGNPMRFRNIWVRPLLPAE